jgi:hypothetical protein
VPPKVLVASIRLAAALVIPPVVTIDGVRKTSPSRSRGKTYLSCSEIPP